MSVYGLDGMLKSPVGIYFKKIIKVAVKADHFYCLKCGFNAPQKLKQVFSKASRWIGKQFIIIFNI